VDTEKSKIMGKLASKLRLDLLSQANNKDSSNKSIGSVISPVKIRQSTMKMPHLFKQTTKDVTAIILGNVNRQSSRSVAAFGI
jgi:CRP-like cAMP-binding protein